MSTGQPSKYLTDDDPIEWARSTYQASRRNAFRDRLTEDEKMFRVLRARIQKESKYTLSEAEISSRLSQTAESCYTALTEVQSIIRTYVSVDLPTQDIYIQKSLAWREELAQDGKNRLAKSAADSNSSVPAEGGTQDGRPVDGNSKK